MQVRYLEGQGAQAYSATLFFEPTGLRLQYADAAGALQTVFWPLEALVPAPVEARATLYLKSSAKAEAQIRFDTMDDYARLWAVYPGRRPALPGQATRQFTGTGGTQKLILMLMAGLLGLLVLGFLVVSNLGDWATALMPRSWDEKAGQALYRSLVRQGQVREDTALSLALGSFYKTAGLPSTFTPQLHYNRSDEVIAFALPGGPIVVNYGLLKAAGSPEALAGVLSHELGHVEHRHTFRQLAQMGALYLVASALVGDVTGVVAVLVEHGQQIFHLSYSRSMERDADEFALQALVRARIDPRGLPAFFEVLKRQEAARGGSNLPGWMNTHPDTDDRIAYLRTQMPRSAAVDTAKARRMQAAFALLKARLTESAE